MSRNENTTARAIVNGYTFESWMLEVLGTIETECGFNAAAEDDEDFESWFCEGYTPREAVREFFQLNSELLERPEEDTADRFWNNAEDEFLNRFYAY